MSKYVEIDDSEVIRLFSNLTGKEMQRARTKAVKSAANILVNATRKSLRRITKEYNKPNRWNGKTLQSGIQRSDKTEDKETVKVHIMGDFRLKFFELGTEQRHNKCKAEVKRRSSRRTLDKPRNTGVMKAKYFFRDAKNQSEKKCFDEMERLLNISIQKIAKKK